MKFPAALAVFCIVILLVPACRDNGGGMPGTVPLPGPYAAMLQEVAAVRGLPPPDSLRIGVVSRDDLPELLDPILRDESARLEHLNTTFRLLGLLPPTVTYAAARRAQLETAAGAMYLPGRREVWLIRDGPLPAAPAGLQPWEQRLLAHEFVHAIQDYHFDLPALERAATTTDSRLGLHALLEGDAAWTESRWTAAYLLPQLSGPGATEPPPAAGSSTPALEREANFLYVMGTEWVTLLRADDPATVDRALRRAPPPTAMVLHPNLAATGWTPGAPGLPGEGLGDGWTAGPTDSLGEFVMASYLQSSLPALASLQAAAGWIGDAARMYRSPAGATALAWRVRFADAKEAGQFSAAHRELMSQTAPGIEASAAMTIAARRDGVTVIQLAEMDDTVTLVFADDPAAARQLAEILANQ